MTYDDAVKVWEVMDPQSKTARSFEQRELSIDGEAQLFQLVYRVSERLQATDFPFGRLKDVFSGPDDSVDWEVAADLLGKAVPLLPDAGAEMVTIMFGIFPFDEDGRRNETFDADKRLVRRWLTISKMVTVLQTFVDQNDYKRLTAPFVTLLGEGMRRGILTSTQQTPVEAS